MMGEGLGRPGDSRLDRSYKVGVPLVFLHLSEKRFLVRNSKPLWGLMSQLWIGVTMPSTSWIGEDLVGPRERGRFSPKDGAGGEDSLAPQDPQELGLKHKKEQSNMSSPGA